MSSASRQHPHRAITLTPERARFGPTPCNRQQRMSVEPYSLHSLPEGEPVDQTARFLAKDQSGIPAQTPKRLA
eukprot:9187656-Pyramimonas_sp.AAC.1